MLDTNTYDLMKVKYGQVGSWAIWKPASTTPKSNTADMSWVQDKTLLSIINTGYVFVGLNWAGNHGDQSAGGTIAWKNFHSGYAYQNDYKLRYALQGTKFWGSYITDVIKYFPESNSKNVCSFMKKHPDVLKKNIESFEEEISYLGVKPVLIALGTDSYNFLNTYLGNRYRIVQIMHYSYQIGQVDYRRNVLDVLNSI